MLETVPIDERFVCVCMYIACLVDICWFLKKQLNLRDEHKTSSVSSTAETIFTAETLMVTIPR